MASIVLSPWLLISSLWCFTRLVAFLQVRPRASSHCSTDLQHHLWHFLKHQVLGQERFPCFSEHDDTVLWNSQGQVPHFEKMAGNNNKKNSETEVERVSIPSTPGHMGHLMPQNWQLQLRSALQKPVQILLFVKHNILSLVICYLPKGFYLFFSWSPSRFLLMDGHKSPPV